MALSPTKININVQILPFGQAATVVRTGVIPLLEEKMPEYGEPKTTDEGIIEINFNGCNYYIPKATGGLF